MIAIISSVCGYPVVICLHVVAVFIRTDVVGIITGVSPPAEYHSAYRSTSVAKRVVYLSDDRYFCLLYVLFHVTSPFMWLRMATTGWVGSMIVCGEVGVICSEFRVGGVAS